MSLDLTDVRRTAYRLGGRTPGHELDCLGTVLVIAQRLGLPAPDPWRAIRDAWANGTLATSDGFGPGWVRLSDSEPARTGDVLLFFGRHPWAAIVVDGYVWSADADVGSVYCRALDRWTKPPAERWRFGST